MFNYTGLQNVAINQIADKGLSAALKRYSGNSYDYATGENTPVYSEIDIKIVRFNYSNAEIDGTIIKNSDIKLLSATRLEVDDIVVIESVEYSVINVKQIQPGNDFICSEAQVRR
jgi:hypothetical protein